VELRVPNVESVRAWRLEQGVGVMAEDRMFPMRKHVHVVVAVVIIVGVLTLGIVAPAGARTPSGRANPDPGYRPQSSWASSGRTVLVGTDSPDVASARLEAHVRGGSKESFEMTLEPRNRDAISALASAVSDPKSSQFHHYLTAAQWEARFSPTLAQVATVTEWLRSAGLKVGTVSADRLSIAASGDAARVERAFKVTLNIYDVEGQSLQLLATNASVPTRIGGLVQGVLGLDQSFATPDIAGPSLVANDSGSAPPPTGYVNAPQCSQYWGQRTAGAGKPSYGEGYADPLPLNICGYLPQQLQSAYGLNSQYDNGVTGQGETVAIVDAYLSPTLLSDAQTYFADNDPTQPLTTSQFTSMAARPFSNQAHCDASGWYTEQSLDVEAVHTTAPGANILFMGATTCSNSDLISAMRTVIDGGLASVITDSWGANSESSGAIRSAGDTLFEMAAETGITVLFSSGDDGDEFKATGKTVPDYPPSSPWVTAVGGTSLAIDSSGSMQFQTSWSTSNSTLCTASAVQRGTCTVADEGTYVPPAPGKYRNGGGGGTSYIYPEPSYQDPVVPAAMADANMSVTGEANRVVPDISMDADPDTGMLIGFTQTFPNGVRYGQVTYGGTSLSSPLFAGIVALTDEAAGGTSLGFLNPALYQADASGSATGFYDVVPQSNVSAFFTYYADGIDADDGYIKGVVNFGYQGPEAHCTSPGNCQTQDVTISTAPGYDNMTGLGTPAPGFVDVMSSY
jgi:subtilase family serine protease